MQTREEIELLLSEAWSKGATHMEEKLRKEFGRTLKYEKDQSYYRGYHDGFEKAREPEVPYWMTPPSCRGK